MQQWASIETGMGWSWLPPEKEDYPWNTKTLPLLSREEQLLVAGVWQAFQSKDVVVHQQGLQPLLREYCNQHLILLEKNQETNLLRFLETHAHGFGPLSILLDDPHIEEITVAGIGKTFPVRVYVQREGWKRIPIYFHDAHTLTTLINRMILDTAKRLSGTTPIVNARLGNGARLHASISPICLHGVELTIRRFTQRATHPQMLLHTHIISSRALGFLSLALESDCSMLIIGNTGSGKTTTLNALLGILPPTERFVVIEETPELQLSHSHVVRLSPSDAAELSLATLVRETLRMRPDRVIVGEIRFPEEGKAFMESLLAGQGKGTYGTFHGHSAAEAVARLKQFGILEQDLSWLNLLITQRRWSAVDAQGRMNEVRAITEIVEVRLDAQQRLELNPIFQWSPQKQQLVEKNKSRIVAERMQWNFPQSVWKTEWDARTEKLERGN